MMFKRIMSVRVQRIGDTYAPQYKGWFLWNYFYRSRGIDYCERIEFDTFDDARKYVCDNQEEYFYPNCWRGTK